MGTYLVVDGNSLTYRAFFALPTDMATASGQVDQSAAELSRTAEQLKVVVSRFRL